MFRFHMLDTDYGSKLPILIDLVNAYRYRHAFVCPTVRRWRRRLMLRKETRLMRTAGDLPYSPLFQVDGFQRAWVKAGQSTASRGQK